MGKNISYQDPSKFQSANKKSALDQAYEAWSEKDDPDTRKKLFEAARPTIDNSIKTYVGGTDPSARSHARNLAYQAFKKYDPKKGAKLRTHLMIQLQPLRRFAARRRHLTHIPEKVQYEMSGIAEAEAALADRLGREPTEEEVADRTGISVKRLKKIRKYGNGVVSESMRRTDEGAPLQDAVVEDNPMDRWMDYVYHDLSPVDKKILEWRTGYNGKPVLKNSDIAKKLRLTPGAVSQRAKKISQQLEEGLNYAAS